MAKKYITQYDRNGEIYYIHDIEAHEKLNEQTSELENIKEKIGEDGEVASKNLLNSKIEEVNTKIDSSVETINNKIEDTNQLIKSSNAEIEEKINSKPVVVGIVENKEKLNLFDTTKLNLNDIIKVLNSDVEDKNPEFYKWNGESFDLLFSDGVGYTKSEIDSLLETKVNQLTSTSSGTQVYSVQSGKAGTFLYPVLNEIDTNRESIPWRKRNGCVQVADPIDSVDAVNKRYLNTELTKYIKTTDETISHKSDLVDLVNKSTLSDYALKTEIPTNYVSTTDILNYVTNEVLDTKLSEIKKCNCGYKLVSELPNTEEAEENIIYLIKGSSILDKNKYDEFILVDDNGAKIFEKIGSASINLDEYYKKTEADAKYAEKTSLDITNSKIEEVNTKIDSSVETINNKIEDTNQLIKSSNAELSTIKTLNDLNLLKAGKYHLKDVEDSPISETDGILETFLSDSATYQKWSGADEFAQRIINKKLSFFVNGKEKNPVDGLIQLTSESDYILSGTLLNAHIEIIPNPVLKFKSAGSITEFETDITYYTKDSNGNYNIASEFNQEVEYFIEDHKSTNITLENLYIESDNKVAIKYIPEYKSVKFTLVGDNKIRAYTTESFTKQDADEAVIYSANNIDFYGTGSLSIMNYYMHHAIKGSDILFKDRPHIYINNGDKTKAHDGIHATKNLRIEYGIFDIKNCNDCFGAGENLTIIAGKFTVDAHNQDVFDCKGSGYIYMSRWYEISDASASGDISSTGITYVNETTAPVIYGEGKIISTNGALEAVKTTGTNGETIYTLSADPLDSGDKPEYEITGYFKDCQISVPVGTNIVLKNIFSVCELTDKNFIFTSDSSRLKLKSESGSVNFIINKNKAVDTGTTISAENSNLELSGSGTLFVISENKYALNIDGSIGIYGNGEKFISGIDSSDTKDGGIRAREIFIGNDKDGSEVDVSEQNIYVNSIYARLNKKGKKGTIQIHTLQSGYIFAENIGAESSTDIASNVKIYNPTEDKTVLSDFNEISIDFPEWSIFSNLNIINEKINNQVKANEDIETTETLNKLTIGNTSYKLQTISYSINEDTDTIDITIE